MSKYNQTKLLEKIKILEDTINVKAKYIAEQECKITGLKKALEEMESQFLAVSGRVLDNLTSIRKLEVEKEELQFRLDNFTSHVTDMQTAAVKSGIHFIGCRDGMAVVLDPKTLQKFLKEYVK